MVTELYSTAVKENNVSPVIYSNISFSVLPQQQTYSKNKNNFRKNNSSSSSQHVTPLSNVTNTFSSSPNRNFFKYMSENS
jgi:hypothetical protein